MSNAPRRRSVDPFQTTSEERSLELEQAALASTRFLLRPVVAMLPQHGTALEVAISAPRVSTSVQAYVTAALERLLGLRQDLHEFYACAAHDSRLNGLARRFSGLKPPRLPTVFEALLNGI